MNTNGILIDHKIIFDVIEKNSTVLDVGCGDGKLLAMLAEQKKCNVQGLELDENCIYQCVERGLSVFHGDIEKGLSEYPDKQFDYIIFNESMQQVKKIDFIIQEALRVGKNVIIGFPNFAHISARLMMFFQGKAPVVESLPNRWYDTPNVRFLSTKDFENYCREKNIKIIKEVFYSRNKLIKIMPNLFAENAIFVLTK